MTIPAFAGLKICLLLIRKRNLLPIASAAAIGKNHMALAFKRRDSDRLVIRGERKSFDGIFSALKNRNCVRSAVIMVVMITVEDGEKSLHTIRSNNKLLNVMI